ncbi:MAG: metal-sulfur cluster assembly factor, partial [Candidatus Poseidoniaceae archaeon]
MVSESEVLEALQTVEDPELEISIVELGLVYAVRIETKDEGPHAEIDLTLTSPGCPAAPEIMAATHR